MRGRRSVKRQGNLAVTDTCHKLFLRTGTGDADTFVPCIQRTLSEVIKYAVSLVLREVAIYRLLLGLRGLSGWIERNGSGTVGSDAFQQSERVFRGNMQNSRHRNADSLVGQQIGEEILHVRVTEYFILKREILRQRIGVRALQILRHIGKRHCAVVL